MRSLFTLRLSRSQSYIFIAASNIKHHWRHLNSFAITFRLWYRLDLLVLFHFMQQNEFKVFVSVVQLSYCLCIYFLFVVQTISYSSSLYQIITQFVQRFQLQGLHYRFSCVLVGFFGLILPKLLNALYLIKQGLIFFLFELNCLLVCKVLRFKSWEPVFEFRQLFLEH